MSINTQWKRERRQARKSSLRRTTVTAWARKHRSIYLGGQENWESVMLKSTSSGQIDNARITINAHMGGKTRVTT